MFADATVGGDDDPAACVRHHAPGLTQTVAGSGVEALTLDPDGGAEKRQHVDLVDEWRGCIDRG